MAVVLNPDRVLSNVDPMIYGQFLEHFHRQVYGGVYDPESPFADEDGFRTDVLEAMKKIRVPIIRWPGGCFVSAYHWEEGVGNPRIPSYNRAWRVVEPNTFGTDEYVKLCRKLGCEPYICTNAGTGTAEEMSNWVEYCNLNQDTRYARMRKANGSEAPFGVKYWSIGNENYGSWEIGAKDAKEWGRLTVESAKMMKRVDPRIELSAAALADMDWTAELLKMCGPWLDWVSIHSYWDFHEGRNKLKDYEACMEYAKDLEKPVRKVRGLLNALGFENIRIAYDEWNLRAWYHPNIHTVYQGKTEDEYLDPRDDNDINSQYTMADAVFTACFLNMCIRNSDIIGMAAFSPVVNTRGMIFTHKDGIVLRSTWHVFDLFVNHMQNRNIDLWSREPVHEDIDLAATADSEGKKIAVSCANRSASEVRSFDLDLRGLDIKKARLLTVNGPDKDSCNSVTETPVFCREGEWTVPGETLTVTLEPHSANVLEMVR